MTSENAPLALEEVQSTVRKLVGAQVHSVTRLAGGGNSQLWRVDSSLGALVLKRANPDSIGDLNRAEREFQFASFLVHKGITNGPRPLALDGPRRIGIYAFVEGESIGVVTEQHVAQAADFLRALQGLRSQPDAEALQPAAEACFSLEQHLTKVEARLARLEQVGTGTADSERFVWDKLRPAWSRTAKAVKAEFKALGFEPQEQVSVESRVLSPSDFGFHNAIQRPDGSLVFLDFEYAGWDDAAKTLSDFMLQPARPVPAQGRKAIADALFPASDSRGRARAAALDPVFRIKWTAILLNELLPEKWSNRVFAGPADRTCRIARQLSMATQMLAPLS